MEFKTYLILSMIMFTVKGTSADIDQDIGTLVVLQIQAPTNALVNIPQGRIKFTHKLLDQANSVLKDMESILVPFDGLYEIDLRGGRFGSDATTGNHGFDVILNINQDSQKTKHFYADPGNDLFGFQVGTIMRLNKNDVINLDNVDSEAFQVGQSFEISLVLTRLA